MQMKTLSLFFAIMISCATQALSDDQQRFIGTDEAECIYSNAEVYLARSLIIIVVDRCPLPGSVTDGFLNDGTSQLPNTENMIPTSPRRPNVLYFSRREFTCLVDYWQNQPADLQEFLIPEDPCE